MTLSRAAAYQLMTEWTESDSLRKHMLAVEAAVVAYARQFGEDETKWAVTALLHDFDYERYPTIGENGHPVVGVRQLRQLGYPEEVLEAILGHADFLEVPRTSLLAKTLYACDEVTGLITAAVLVRPDKDIAHLEVGSLKKKFKDKAFARGVNREDIRRGALELGIELWEHVSFVLAAMQQSAAVLGLDGRLAR
ncbi:MAG: HDIG domain-containing protein [Truepera sp.]|nr:HDIG domain-containing protein [Truepera sp.]MBS3967139.1 HDIG domain-containing protein [Truepera sp.]